jgi:transcriptional regulator GlxA family with amidase domain
MKRSEILYACAGASIGAVVLSAPAGAASAPPLPFKKNQPITVAFVVGEGANVMDMSGPWEVFQDTMVDGWDKMAFSLYTVSDHAAPMQATGGLTIVPMYKFANAPQPNVIMMGAQGEHTPEKIEWIRQASKKADVVMSVCTGAFLLAQTGLLDGLSATTHHDFYDKFSGKFPQVTLVRDVRYVENPGGKFCSAGGITSGMELALRVVERYFGGRPTAQTAFYMEYVRSPQRPVAPGVA